MSQTYFQKPLKLQITVMIYGNCLTHIGFMFPFDVKPYFPLRIRPVVAKGATPGFYVQVDSPVFLHICHISCKVMTSFTCVQCIVAD